MKMFSLLVQNNIEVSLDGGIVKKWLIIVVICTTMPCLVSESDWLLLNVLNLSDAATHYEKQHVAVNISM